MTDFSVLLKSYRTQRRLSQLDMALDAGVSARHVSFLETGRSKPTRDMVLRLCRTLKLPLSRQNQMLAGAGFSNEYQKSTWDSEDMVPIVNAIDHMLSSHAPYPGLSYNDDWVVTKMNTPAQTLFSVLGFEVGQSLLDLLVGDALPAMIANWPVFAHYVAERLRTESATLGGKPRFEAVAGILEQDAKANSEAKMPVVPTIFVANGLKLSMFATIAQFGTPLDESLDGYKVELYYPSDSETKKQLEMLFA